MSVDNFQSTMSDEESHKSASGKTQDIHDIVLVNADGHKEQPAIDPSDKLVMTLDKICVKVGEKQILINATAYAESGGILAVMGPSGSGKTTLMNTISGRMNHHSGAILMNNMKISSRSRKKFGYVTQQDIFFPQLTLQQSLQFAADIKLPSKISSAEKTRRINQVIDSLDLRKCSETLVGNFIMPGLSGGEKKRLNIACELIRNPKVILLDEPTSGLDSSLAMTIIKLLQNWAEKENKIVITSIHQPSSQIFHIFENLLLMTDGHVTYFGKRSGMVDYFSSIGVPFHPHWNPADFMLEVVNSHSDKKDVIIKESVTFEELKFPSYDSLKRIVSDISISSNGLDAAKNEKTVNTNNGVYRLRNTEGHVNSSFEAESPNATDNAIENGITCRAATETHNVEMPEQETKKSKAEFSTSEFQVSWWQQFKALAIRSFLVTRARLFSVFPIIQFTFVALITGLLWFQIPKREEQIIDIMGVIFFVTINLSFQPLFEAIMTFHEDVHIVKHERRSGMYNISAYYLAKMATEMPMQIVLPFITLTAIFWLSGLGSVQVYFPFIFVIILNSIACQGIGIFFSLLTEIPKANMTCAFIFMMFSLLTGGYFTTSIPVWLDWSKWLSFIRYCYHFNMYMIFMYSPDFRCAQNRTSVYTACTLNITTAANITERYFPGSDIIDEFPDKVLEPWACILVIVLFFFAFRLAGYLWFRFVRKL